MSVTVHATAFGAPAYRVLAEVVRTAKSGDPLTPVTLVVPGERVGVAARRALARGIPGRPGVAAVQIVTLRRLAETLAAESLIRAGRRPLTGPVLIGAVRSALIAEPGIFAPVADHIGTVRAVAQAHRALRPLSPVQLDALATQGAVVADTVRLHRTLNARLAAGSFDEVDLLHAATAAVRHRSPESVVLFLPQDLDPPETAFLARVAETARLHVVLGLTGDEHADAGPLHACHALGVTAACPVGPPLGDEVLHASDPDDEVRGVVRRMVAALAEHPGHRVAVLYGTADPYARLLHEHLDRAGVTRYGRGVRSTAESRHGRAILRLLALPDHDFRRDEVLAFVADAPVRHDDARAPSSAWERVSRAAGVVGGADWGRLASFAADRDRHAAATENDEAWRAERARRDADQARGLHAFVTGLRQALAGMAAAATWRELGDVALRLWQLTLAGDDLDALPPDEQRAAERIGHTLRSLAGLDEVAGPADPTLLRELLELELADDLDRVGRIGEGVHVGPVSDGAGEDVDLVFVVGAAEGVLPPRASDDPLLPDRARALTGGDLPTQPELTARRHRHLLAALAAAPAGRRILSFPRGDLRAGGVRVPSRWLLPTLRALSGRPDLPATRWDEVAGLHELPSYAGALEREPRPATEQEWRQRAAVAAAPAPADPVLARAIEARTARASATFTAFDGNLAGEVLPDPTAGGVVSATALEAWVCCPYGYFVRHLLRVTPVEQPEDVVRISPLDRGNVVHEILETLVKSAVDEGWAPGPGHPWPPRAHEVLRAAGDERFTQAEQEGVTGFALLWAADQAAIRTDLDAWLAQDDRRRAELGVAPVAAEWSFGGAEVPLGDGRAVRLRGKIDRIDTDTAGGLVVTDYKTGKAEGYRAIGDDPINRGQRLQLPLYGQIAGAEFGAARVRSEYWFTSRRARFERIGYELDDAVLARTREALRTVVDGIRGGVFPARPEGKDNVLYRCDGCDPDGLGERGVVAEAWERMAGAAELVPLRVLLGLDAAS